jgi:hypothetical protein
VRDRIQPACIEEHQRLLEKALSLPLPDAVFAIVHYNLFHRVMGPAPHCEEIPISAISEFGRISSELDIWRAKSLSLRRNAYSVGEALLRDREAYDAAKGKLIMEHPGFGEESYEAAISFGCFQAR